jgi:hypothetical protein
MSQLAKIENNNPLLQPNALNSVKEDLFKAVNAAIAKCYADLNFKVPEDPSYLVNEVTDSIMERFPSMRIAEVPVAFANGIRGKYGEYFGLCVVSFEQFIQGYLESADRIKLVHDKNRLQLEQKTEPTANEKFDTARQLVMNAYEKVKTGKPIGITATTVYAFLNSIGLIGTDYKHGAMEDAMPQLVKDKEVEIAMCTNLIKRRELNAALEMLKQNLANDILTKEQHEECKRVAKRLVITNWLRDALMNEANLAQIIEQQRDLYLQYQMVRNQKSEA